MALTITFCAPAPNNISAMRGGSETTESLTLSASSAASTNAASADQPICSLLAGEDCWVAFGATPTAAANTGRKLLAGTRLEVHLAPGSKVAGITA